MERPRGSSNVSLFRRKLFLAAWRGTSHRHGPAWSLRAAASSCQNKRSRRYHHSFDSGAELERGIIIITYTAGIKLHTDLTCGLGQACNYIINSALF